MFERLGFVRNRGYLFNFRSVSFSCNQKNSSFLNQKAVSSNSIHKYCVIYQNLLGSGKVELSRHEFSKETFKSV